MLINSIVFSKLYYCSTVWSNTSATNLKKLQWVQNFAARIVLGLRKFDHISEGIKSLNWPTVQQKLFLNDAIMIFKCLHNLVPSYLSDKFTTRSKLSKKITRSCNQLHIPLCRLSVGQRSFSYRGSKLWNSLPKETQNLQSLRLFKKAVHQSLLSDQ